MPRTFWALYRVHDPSRAAPLHWVVRSQRPGAPNYLVQLLELVRELQTLRESVVLESALAACGLAPTTRVERLGDASPMFLEPDDPSALLALHGGPLEVWVAWPRAREPGESADISLWTAVSEDELWAWIEDNEDDRHIETLARPAERIEARLWTPWDFRLWEEDLLWVPEAGWLASSAWEAWSRHEEFELDALRGPRAPCPELSEAEHRSIWVRRFDRLIEQRRSIDDLRARTWDLAVLAEIDAGAALTRLDALLDELRARPEPDARDDREGEEDEEDEDEDDGEIEWISGLVSTLRRASAKGSAELSARLARWRTGDAWEQALASAYDSDVARYPD